MAQNVTLILHADTHVDNYNFLSSKIVRLERGIYSSG